MTADPAEISLFDALAWRLRAALPGHHPGPHRARMRGAGDAFADVAPLLAHPDPRRLDVRRSITDPFGTMFVRRFETRTDLTLHLLLDASASLSAGASSDRQGLAALLVAGFAQAAFRGGDLFALTAVGGDAVLAQAPRARRAGMGAELREQVLDMTPAGSGVAGLCDAVSALPQSRVLVVLLSDFDHAPDELDRLLSALDPRPVLPIWLRDSGLENPPGRFGLAEARDPETGRRRTFLTTRKWAAGQARAAREHRTALMAVFADHGLHPVDIVDSIDVGDLVAALAGAAG